MLIILIVCLSCKDDQKINRNEEVSVYIGKKDMLDNNSLMIELWFSNNSDINYLLPVSPTYMLENRKKLFNPVFGRIITSDFTDSNDYKMNFLLDDYTEKYSYKGFSRQSYKMAIYKDYEGFANSLLFISKKTKKRMFLIFNLYESCNDSPQKCNGIFYDNLSKINLSIIDYPNNFKILDSLLEKEKIDYQVYRKLPYLKDSLFINK